MPKDKINLYLGDLLEPLVQAAERNGKNISNEIRWRLRRSFNDGDMPLDDGFLTQSAERADLRKFLWRGDRGVLEYYPKWEDWYLTDIKKAETVLFPNVLHPKTRSDLRFYFDKIGLK